MAPCGIVKDAPSSKKPASAIPVWETMAQNDFSFKLVSFVTSVPGPLESLLSKIPWHKTEQLNNVALLTLPFRMARLGVYLGMKSWCPRRKSWAANSVGVAKLYQLTLRQTSLCCRGWTPPAKALNNILGVSCFHLKHFIQHHNNVMESIRRCPNLWETHSGKVMAGPYLLSIESDNAAGIYQRRCCLLSTWNEAGGLWKQNIHGSDGNCPYRKVLILCNKRNSQIQGAEDLLVCLLRIDRNWVME